MIPCMMLVLGAVLHKGPGSVNVPTRLIAGVSAFRLIIIPLLGKPCCALHAYDTFDARLCRCDTGIWLSMQCDSGGCNTVLCCVFLRVCHACTGTAALLLLRRAGVYDPPDKLFMLVLFLV